MMIKQIIAGVVGEFEFIRCERNGLQHYPFVTIFSESIKCGRWNRDGLDFSHESQINRGWARKSTGTRFIRGYAGLDRILISSWCSYCSVNWRIFSRQVRSKEDVTGEFTLLYRFVPSHGNLSELSINSSSSSIPGQCQNECPIGCS